MERPLPQPVVLLEDDPSRVQAEVETLEALGYRVFPAADSAAALDFSPHAHILVIAVHPGAGRRQAAAGAALQASSDIPMVLWVADAAAAELSEFDSLLYFAAVPQSAGALFLKNALQMAPKHAAFRREHLQNEALLQHALAGAQEGTWDWQIETHQCSFSPEWNALLGYAAGDLQNTFSEWEDRVHPDDLPACHAAMQAHLRGETSVYHNIHRLRSKDGSYRWILDRGRVSQRAADGRPLRVIGTYCDITESKQAELQLQQWENIFKYAHWGVVVSSRDGQKIALANPAFAAMHGSTVEALVDTPVLDIFAPEARADALQHIHSANQQGHYTFESLHLRQDGSLFPVSINITVVRDQTGAFQYRIVNVQDISQRKAAEAQLRQSEEKYRTLVNTLSEGVSLNQVVYAENGEMSDYRVVEANPAFYNTADYQGPVIGSLATLLYGMTHQFINAFWQRHKTLTTTQYTEMTSPISGRHFVVATSPILNDHFVTSFFDITQRKQVEAALAQREAHFRLLIEHTLLGYAYCQMLYENELPRDYLYLEVNPAFERITGLKDVVGKPVSTVIPGIHQTSPELITYYARVAATGEPETFDYFVEALQIWFNVSVYSPQPGYFIALFTNITEKKKVEIALRESEERYRTLFENMQEGFALQEVILDDHNRVIDFRLLAANQAYQKLTGTTLENALGRTLLETQPHADRLQIERYGNVALTGEPLVLEYFSRTFQRHLRVSAFRPRPGQFATLFEDVSEMRQAEAALRESEQKYRALFENEIFAIVLFDQQTLRILDANAASEKLYGYTRAELLAEMTSLDLSAEQPVSAAATQDVTHSGSTFVPLRYHRRKDSSIFPVEIVARAFVWQGRLVIFAIIHDITERIRAQQQMQESEARFRHMADTAPVLIWMSGPDALRHYFNVHWLTYTGRTLEQEMGNGWAAGVHPDDFQRCAETYLGAFHLRRAFEIEYRLRRADGAYGWLFDRGVPRFTPSGAFLGYIGSCIDITERKHAEELLQNANQQMRLQLAEIEQLQDQLRQQALHDALTGLYNRHYLAETLTQEIARSARESAPLSVIMADIDHFKGINDTYGHPVGDQFLVKIADLMKNSVRGSDFVCRFGGEELLLVLPGASAEAAVKRSEDLRQQCADIVIPWAGQALQVTLSFGVAVYPVDGQEADVLILKADQALYHSKNAGRNRTTLRQEIPPPSGASE